MIKSENGKLTLAGSIDELSRDLACVARGIKQVFEEQFGAFGKDMANTIVIDAVKSGLMTDDELIDSIKDIKGKRKKLESEMGAEEKKVADLFMSIIKDKKV